MKSKRWHARDNEAGVHRDSGFTLVELVLVLVVVFVLATLLIPPTTGHGGPSIRIKCLSNVKQIGYGLIQYGNENNDRLPEASAGSGHWAWDMPMVLNDVMARQGVTRQVMYDPGFPQQNDDRLWNAAPDKYRVIGYALTLGGSSSSVTASNQNSMISTQFILQDNGTSMKPDPSKRVLVAGAVITQGGQNKTNEVASYNWTKVKSSYPILHRSAHLDKAKKLPVGENEAMLDGSARWVNWQKMIPRTAGPADVATFWW
jgi:type II secretory pathway pseudopilin PulG